MNQDLISLMPEGS